MKGRRRSLGVITLALVAATGSACTAAGSADDEIPSHVAGTPVQRPPEVSGPSDDHEHEYPSAAPYPSSDAASDEASLATATAAMVAFARPDLDEETWWSDLSPMLSPAAAEAYQATDPANVPASAVTCTATLNDSASPYLADVTVPTDVGRYNILLSREGQGEPWLVERISPPAPGDPAPGTTA